MTHLLENIRCVNNFQLEEKGEGEGGGREEESVRVQSVLGIKKTLFE